jgi:hypothetical protein
LVVLFAASIFLESGRRLIACEPGSDTIGAALLNAPFIRTIPARSPDSFSNISIFFSFYFQLCNY